MAIIIMLDNQYWNSSARMAILEWRTSNVYINHYKILRTSNLTSLYYITQYTSSSVRRTSACRTARTPPFVKQCVLFLFVVFRHLTERLKRQGQARHKQSKIIH